MLGWLTQRPSRWPQPKWLQRFNHWRKSLPTFKEWRKQRHRFKLLAEEQRILERDLQEKAAIAMAFNNRYTTGARYDKSCDDPVPGGKNADGGLDVKQGYRWMCPDCNTIHAPLEFSIWTGLQYPACCRYRRGDRNDDIGPHANLKRPKGWCGPGGLFRKFLAEGIEPKAKVQ